MSHIGGGNGTESKGGGTIGSSHIGTSGSFTAQVQSARFVYEGILESDCTTSYRDIEPLKAETKKKENKREYLSSVLFLLTSVRVVRLLQWIHAI